MSPRSRGRWGCRARPRPPQALGGCSTHKTQREEIPQHHPGQVGSKEVPCCPIWQSLAPWEDTTPSSRRRGEEEAAPEGFLAGCGADLCQPRAAWHGWGSCSHRGSCPRWHSSDPSLGPERPGWPQGQGDPGRSHGASTARAGQVSPGHPCLPQRASSPPHAAPLCSWDGLASCPHRSRGRLHIAPQAWEQTPRP